MKSAKATQQYLQRYAEPVGALLSDFTDAIDIAWEQALVIPACREGDGFIRRLLDCDIATSTLVIVVLNGPPGITEADQHSTLQALDCLNASCQLSWQTSDGFLQLFENSEHGFLCVNLLNPPLEWPLQAGVGYARKLGTDIALWLHVAGRVHSPWVRSSDADVDWPADYFSPLKPPVRTSAVLYPFVHAEVLDEDNIASDAVWLYDAWLRYYVAGLRWSGSPWAFHTIGSTLAIHLGHYAMQRGFPKREAGEDFYLLNKLAKSGAVDILAQPELQLSHRMSDRTPFGTGHGIRRIMASGNDWPFYHPQIFVQLALWHQWLPLLSDSQTQAQLPKDEPVFAVLHSLGLADILKHCQRQCKTPVQFTHHLWQWFDAALTRKCVHLLRDRYYGTLHFAALLEAIHAGNVPFITANGDIHSAEKLSCYLRLAETQPDRLGLDHG